MTQTSLSPFEYQSFEQRVVFAANSITRVGEEVARLGQRALVLCTPEQLTLAQRVAGLLGERAVAVHDGAVMHVPVGSVEAAMAVREAAAADCLVAVGGGSTIGLAKAIALRTGLPILALPTTYAGSEMTPVWGLTDERGKRTGRDAKVLPRITVYDPDLTLTLPFAMTVTSGINAMAHCVEGLYSEVANPMTSLMAEEGIRALAEALPRLQQDDQDRQGRFGALYGAWLGGHVLGTVGMALHHKLCHVLGGSFNLPHAATHTIVLPHVLAYNRMAAPEAMARVARALGAGDADPAATLHQLIKRLGAPLALKDVGLPRDGIEAVVHETTANPYYNPAPIRAEAVRKLLEHAHAGQPPGEYA